MRGEDVDAAEQLTARAYAQAIPEAPPHRNPEQLERWTSRIHHQIETDPAGCWVAQDGSDVIGVAVAMRRDLLWVLSTYAVDPDIQGRGVGVALLDAALAYGAGCLRGLICSTNDSRAVRRYRRAGFTINPTMQLRGTVQADAVPFVDGVRTGTDADLDIVDSVDRRVRGATHRPDHRLLGKYAELLVCDLLTGNGYVYVDGPRIALLAATSRSIAQRLLWSALRRTGGEAVIRTLTADQDWALDVGLAAGLEVQQDAYLALRHMRPPSPYIPSVAFG
jgi:GNAT superfamily N-acetyltransferase